MIHFHGTPMTPVADMIEAFKKRHAMVSFQDSRQIEVATEICQSVVLDNGAFSAWRAGKEHDFEGYMEFAYKWIKHPCVEWCVIPDVIDGDAAANDRLISKWPLSSKYSVPVYHLHEPIARLTMLARDFPRVALGSSGEFSEPGSVKWWTRMAEVMNAVCDSDGFPRCKLHGLRMLDPVIFSHLPLSSADSCNVARNVGIDKAWNGPYAPASRAQRALILMDRIEAHGSARRWCHESSGVQQNMELMG